MSRRRTDPIICDCRHCRGVLREPDEPDDLAPARGVLLAVAIGALSWLLVAAVWWAVVSMAG